MADIGHYRLYKLRQAEAIMQVCLNRVNRAKDQDEHDREWQKFCGMSELVMDLFFVTPGISPDNEVTLFDDMEDE